MSKHKQEDLDEEAVADEVYEIEKTSEEPVEIKPLDLVTGVLAQHRLHDPHPLVKPHCSCGLFFWGEAGEAEAREHLATKILEVLA